MNWSAAVVVAALLGMAGTCDAGELVSPEEIRTMPADAGLPASSPTDVRPTTADPSPNPQPIVGAGREKADLPKLGAPLRPWPIPPRPSWAWPPRVRPQWAWAPGSLTGPWMWRSESPDSPRTIMIASVTSTPPMGPWSKPPSWLQDVSRAMMTTTAAPPWPRLPPPNFRLPTGRSRFADQKNLEPPQEFVRWSDRLENVLLGDREVDRRCRNVGAKSPPGKIIRGCSRRVAGRCLIIRVDDPGVARHELAHCNGWKHE